MMILKWVNDLKNEEKESPKLSDDIINKDLINTEEIEDDLR